MRRSLAHGQIQANETLAASFAIPSMTSTGTLTSFQRTSSMFLKVCSNGEAPLLVLLSIKRPTVSMLVASSDSPRLQAGLGGVLRTAARDHNATRSYTARHDARPDAPSQKLATRTAQPPCMVRTATTFESGRGNRTRVPIN